MNSEFNINRFLPYLLDELASQFSDDFAMQYQQTHQMTKAQWRVIAHLSAQGSATAKSLCDLANMDKSTVSRAIKQLEEKRWVVMSPHPTDKRALLARLTEEGVAVYEDIVPKALSWEATKLHKLSEEQKVLFFDVLDKLMSDLK